MRAVFHLAPLLLFGPACWAADETLAYSIQWPTGIAMGTARLSVSPGARSTFELDASLPGIPATGTFSSRPDAKGCTSEFTKKYELGFRQSSERIVVDGAKASRETTNGGKSVMEAGACPHDALAYLNLLRQILANVKPSDRPTSTTVLFGAKYQLTMEYPKSEGTLLDTVRFQLKGPSSQHSFEIDFLRDAGRTPQRVRVPLAMGQFVLELVR